jgi:hypothetical protein
MEPTAPEAEQQEQPENKLQQLQTVIKKYVPEKYSKLLSNKRLAPFLIGIVILLIAIPILLLLFSGPKGKSQQTGPLVTPTQGVKQIKAITKPLPTTKKQSSQTFVYGTWTSQTSVIRAVDTSTFQTVNVAALPLTIKKVNVLSDNTLLYVDQTDNNDYGQRLSVYNIQQNQIVVNIPADPGFGIDDYLLSPNKQYLVMWEVKLSKDTGTLQGGQSRVYSLNMSQPTVTNRLYDETATPTVPIHYPRAILNNGTVLTDQMIPNDPNGGAGWAYGMSIVDFDGSNKQNILSMTNGTYGSQPVLSSDGKYLLFAGYDGANGNGTSVKNGYRQALLTPNTVELLDTKTLQRFKLPNLPNTNIYSDVQWDSQTGNVIISMLTPSSSQTGVYSYDLAKLNATPIPLPSQNGTPYGYISELSNTKTLIGIQSTNSSNLGNLGQTYSYAYTQLATLAQGGKLTNFTVQDPFVQYITILPQNYFKNVLGTQTHAQDVQPTISSVISQPAGSPNPQLNTFFLKTNLASNRLQAESNPLGSASSLTCLDLGNARCSALGLSPNSQAYAICQNVEKQNSLTENACY